MVALSESLYKVSRLSNPDTLYKLSLSATIGLGKRNEKNTFYN